VKIITIDGPIGTQPGEFSARWLRSQLPTSGPIQVRIHSEGGSVFEAFAMFDIVSGYRGRKSAVVASAAFSAASLLLCAFDRVEATENSYCMIHAPYAENGDAGPLLANLRQKMIGIYARRTGQAVETVASYIDQETFFDVESAISFGLVDSVASVVPVAKIRPMILAKIQASGCSATQRWKAELSKLAGSMPMAKAAQQIDRLYPGLRQQMIFEANQRRQ
jgi:ATP-dependent protease ClpP protease subunit